MRRLVGRRPCLTRRVLHKQQALRPGLLTGETCSCGHARRARADTAVGAMPRVRRSGQRMSCRIQPRPVAAHSDLAWQALAARPRRDRGCSSAPFPHACGEWQCRPALTCACASCPKSRTSAAHAQAAVGYTGQQGQPLQCLFSCWSRGARSRGCEDSVTEHRDRAPTLHDGPRGARRKRSARNDALRSARARCGPVRKTARARCSDPDSQIHRVGGAGRPAERRVLRKRAGARWADRRAGQRG